MLGKQHIKEVIKQFLDQEYIQNQLDITLTYKKQKKEYLYQILDVTKLVQEDKAQFILKINNINAQKLIQITQEKSLNIFTVEDKLQNMKFQHHFSFFPYDQIDQQNYLFQNKKFEQEFFTLKKPSDSSLKDQTGAFGEVYISMHKLDNQVYAIKKIFDLEIPNKILHLDKTFKKRVRECQALMKMNHPNIVKCYNWWIEQSQEKYYNIYIQMQFYGEYIQGCGNLIRYIKNDLSLMNLNKRRIQAYQIFQGISDGLQYIHSLGYVHRDIRPENIFIEQPNPFNQNKFKAVLGDFGLTKVIWNDVDQNLDTLQLEKKPSQSFVKNLYSAEECNSIYDNYSDIFNLGLVLFDILNCQTNLETRKQLQYDLKFGKIPQEFQNKFPIESKILQILISYDIEKRETGQTQRMEYLKLLPEYDSIIIQIKLNLQVEQQQQNQQLPYTIQQQES